MSKFVNCVICGSSEYNVIFRENEAQTHQIVKCNTCGLMYANPQKRIIPEVPSRQKTLSLTDYDKQYIRKQYNQLPDYKRIALFINKIRSKKGKLLEVGASAGVLLNFLKNQGWDVVGIEPAKQYVEYAKSQFGLNILQITLEQSTFKEDSFDVVIMTHLIEHLNDPSIGLEKINSLLKRGGLLIIETPKYDTLIYRLLGRRERSLSCPTHLYFFTSVTLKKLIEKHNFKIIRKEIVGRTLAMDRLLWNIGVISKNNFIKRILERLSVLLHLDKFIIHINMRDMQRIYCEKI